MDSLILFLGIIIRLPLLFIVALILVGDPEPRHWVIYAVMDFGGWLQKIGKRLYDWAYKWAC